MTTPTVSDSFYEFNDNDHTALVASVTIIFALLTVTSVVAKLSVRRGITTLQAFDYVLLVGAVLTMIQAGLIVSATKEGLGLHSNMSDNLKESIRKVLYPVHNYRLADSSSYNSRL